MSAAAGVSSSFSSSSSPWGELQPSPRGRSAHQQQRQGDLCFVLPDSMQQRQHRHKQQLAPGCLLLGRHAHQQQRRSTTPPFFASLTAIAQDWRSSSSSKAGDKQQQQQPGVISIGLLLQPLLQQKHQDEAHAAGGSTKQTQEQEQAAAVSRKQQQHAKQRQKQHQCAAASSSSQHAGGAKAKDEEGEQSSRSTAPPPCRWLDQLGQAKLLLAGAASAVVSRTAMAPLERVKMDLLLKTSSRSALGTALWVLQKEGLGGFWRGNGLNLLRTAPFKVRCGVCVCVYVRCVLCC
jgi:hypothetical protein